MPRKNSGAPEQFASSMGEMITARRSRATAETEAHRSLVNKMDDLEEQVRHLKLEVAENETEVERSRSTVAIAREFVSWAKGQQDAGERINSFAASFDEALRAVVDDDVPSELEARERGAA